MANRTVGILTQWLCRRAAGAHAQVSEDGDLLESFVAQRDEAAFAELVHRYGPLVYKLCRGLGHNEHEAADAFQATFLVFLRKAGSIRKHASVGSWLYAVAYRVANHMKSAAATETISNPEELADRGPEPEEDVTRRDRDAALHEEVNRLPEKYRTPLVLCYLEGKTFDEAARRLRCPPGTVATRLAWARERLRSRLTRRGIGVSGAALAAELTANRASAALPGALLFSTIKAARFVAEGNTIAAAGFTAQTAALTEGVLRSMNTTQLKHAAALAFFAGTILLGAGLLAWQTPASGQTDGKQASAPRAGKQEAKPSPDAEKLQGNWLAIAIEQDGRAVPEELLKKVAFRVVVKGNQLTLQLPGEGEVVYKFRLIPAKKINQIETTRITGPQPGGEGEISTGIYSLDGDIWKWCWGEGKPVPAGFGTEFASGYRLFVLKREAGEAKELAPGEKKADAKVKALRKEQRDTAVTEVKARYQEVEVGRGSLELFYAAERRLLQVQLDLSEQREERLGVLYAHYRLMVGVEKMTKERFDAGRIPIQDYQAVKFWRLEAEVMLERAKDSEK